MRVGTSYRQRPPTGAFDVIVIGSGLGGLTAAALLARHGEKRVLVLERHYTAGGFTHVFRRPGYEWDVGVHYVGEVTDPDSDVRGLFDHITDRKLAWADMGEVYDTVVVGEDEYEFVKGAEAFRERLARYFPAERPAIARYVQVIQGSRRAREWFFMEKALPGPIAAVAGPALRWPAMRRARRTTREALERLTGDERLISVLAAQWGDYGLPPGRSSFLIHAIVADHYLNGGAYPVGGATRIASTIVPGIERTGGAVITSAEVTEIVVQDGRAVGARLADGNELRAPVVISDAGAATTFGRLLPEETAGKQELAAAIRAIGPSTGHVSLYLGVHGSDAELGLGRSNRWVFPGDDHDGNVVRFLTDRSAPLPVVFISFPSAKDPEFPKRHSGRATIEALTLAPYEWFRRWEDTSWRRRGEEYEATKAEFTERLLQVVYRCCPQVRGRIEVSELSTPLTTRHFTGHDRGAMYGLAHTPARFAERRLRPRTPVPGLYLAGADVATCGLAGALFGGLLTASVVLRRNLFGVWRGSGRP